MNWPDLDLLNQHTGELNVVRLRRIASDDVLDTPVPADIATSLATIADAFLNGEDEYRLGYGNWTTVRDLTRALVQTARTRRELLRALAVCEAGLQRIRAVPGVDAATLIDAILTHPVAVADDSTALAERAAWYDPWSSYGAGVRCAAVIRRSPAARAILEAEDPGHPYLPHAAISAADFDDRWGVLVRWSPADAARLAVDDAAELPYLTAAHIAPLLAHDDETIRRSALRALGALPAKPSTPPDHGRQGAPRAHHR